MLGLSINGTKAKTPVVTQAASIQLDHEFTTGLSPRPVPLPLFGGWFSFGSFSLCACPGEGRLLSVSVPCTRRPLHLHSVASIQSLPYQNWLQSSPVFPISRPQRVLEVDA